MAESGCGIQSGAVPGPHRRGVRRPDAASASMADINIIIGRADGGSRLWLSKTVSAISRRITSNRCANSGERARAHSTAPASLRLNVPAANQGRSNSSSTTPRTPPSVIIMADPARPKAAPAAHECVHVLRKSVAPDPRSPSGPCPINVQSAHCGQQPCKRSGAETSFGSSANGEPRLDAENRTPAARMPGRSALFDSGARAAT